MNSAKNKKRILVQLHYLELGGAEKALLGLLEAIDKERYDVDLFLNQHTGAFMPLIPENVNLLPEIPEYAALEQSLSYSVRHGLWNSAVRKIKRRYKLSRYLSEKPGFDSVASHIYMDNEIDSLPDLYKYGRYDLAISFLDPPHIVQDKVNAKKKIEWIHTDFASLKYDRDLTFERWNKNDYIISISDDITKSFTSVFPTLLSKIRVIENIISPSFVRQQALGEIKDFEIRHEHLVLCSMGRLNAEAKNFKSIPKIASALKAKGVRFQWLVIGPGEKDELERLISEQSVEENIHLLGSKDNPYPYIHQSDIYVQPSLYEGKSIAVREAQILCKPVIITNYPTSASQIKNGIDGIICDMDNDIIADTIVALSRNKEQYDSIVKYLECHDYGMASEVEKLYDLI